MSKFIVRGGNTIQGVVTPSGNKNEALPCLLATLLTEKPVTLNNVPRIQDVLSVCEILKSLGAVVEWTSDSTVVIEAKKINTHVPEEELCCKVRASILLLGPMLARVGKIELAPPGGDVIGARRLDTHFEGAKALGAHLAYGHPIVGHVEKLQGADFFLDEPSVTATENLVTMAVLAEGTTVLHNAACEPHVVGLCKMLVRMGAKIEGIGSNRLTIKGVRSLDGAEHDIGPDFMEVGSFLCLGSVGGGVVRIEGVNTHDLKPALRVWKKIGIDPKIGKDFIEIDGSKPLKIERELGGRIGTVYSGPWPAFPTDLMSVTILAATRAEGTIIFFEKMFEGRMFFTDKLMGMGANIVLCDPHRIVINGPSQLYGAHQSSPDVRAGVTILMAACIATGTSEIDNIYQIERGYFNIEDKLRGLGVDITREE